MIALQIDTARFAAGGRPSRLGERFALALALCALAACGQDGGRAASDMAGVLRPAHAAPAPKATWPPYPAPAADAVEHTADDPAPPTF